jgi:hypothetical protein
MNALTAFSRFRESPSVAVAAALAKRERLRVEPRGRNASACHATRVMAPSA